MKNIKIFLVIFMALFATASFAAWSQPTATPPNGNTLPPINVGTGRQDKQGPIGATQFCILPNLCLSYSAGGNLSINGGIISSGTINAAGFCLGGSCVSNWNNLASLILPSGLVTGSGNAGNITMWTGSGSSIGNAGFTATQVQNAITGAGLWTVSGNAVVPTASRVINSGANSIKVQMGTPATPEDGMIWIAQ